MISKAQINSLIERRIRALADERGTLQILEAGCGRRWPFDLSGLDYSITGIDLDANALEFRKSNKRDLDVAVVGDIRNVALEDKAFDVIYCSFVLEHVEGVSEVLENFAAWIRPGGLLIITIPDWRSVHGFITRLTPHWFHVLYKRFFSPLGRRAGTPGFGPYRTVYDPVLQAHAFQRLCSRLGFELIDQVKFGSLPRYQQSLTRVISLLSANHLEADHIDLLYVLRCRTPQPAGMASSETELRSLGGVRSR